ncbi:MAG: glycoside hydrolase family 125 protein, partial [bacterium]|nr:glycoside hydrolase family 125 protein [bacterium]
LIIQALTSDDEKEINACVKMLVNNTGNTGYMHESIHKDNDALYSRAWFAWANSLFSILILKERNVIDGIEHT